MIDDINATYQRACAACVLLALAVLFAPGCGDEIPGMNTAGFNLPQHDGSLLPAPDGSPHHDDAGPDAGDAGAPDEAEADVADAGTEAETDAAQDAGDTGHPPKDGGRDAGIDAGHDAGAATALTGTFITKSSVASKIQQTGLSPNPQVAPASQYFVITYEQSGKHLRFVTKICYLDLPDTKAVGGSRVTETWWKKRPVSEFLPSIVSEGDFLSTPDPGAAYTPAEQTVFLGYDGSKDNSVPSNPSTDARVFDQDGDTKKGITLHIEGMPVIGSVDGYCVEKTVTKESGTYISPNRIEGKIDFYTAEENVFDGSNPLVKGNSKT